MDRRMFVLAVGLALVTLPRESGAQSAQKLYRIAFIEAGSASANQHFLDVFDSGLRDLGYIDGKNVIVDTQWAEGQAEGFRRALRELIKLRPDVIVVSSTVGAVEAQRATTSIPIVFIGVSDPLGRLAAGDRIPAVYEFGEFARAGGLIAYASGVSDQFRRAAIYVDKILKGAKPADLSSRPSSSASSTSRPRRRLAS